TWAADRVTAPMKLSDKKTDQNRNMSSPTVNQKTEYSQLRLGCKQKAPGSILSIDPENQLLALPSGR
ncbi:MAG: hypothetical protein ABIJ61_10095, partial [bacterium]